MLRIVVQDRYKRGRTQMRTCQTWKQVEKFIHIHLRVHLQIGDFVLVYEEKQHE